MNNLNQAKLKQNATEISVELSYMMVIKQGVSLRLSDYIKNGYVTFLLSLFIGLACHPYHLYGNNRTDPETITYYLYIADFAKSFIQIPTSNVSGESPTKASSYLAGRAPIYDVNNKKFGTCSASFLSMKTEDGIFTDISNYLSADNGLIVTWFTPTTLINLELDSIINSMVTQCIVAVTTKVGFSPFFGQTFNLIVSSDSEKIYFQFSKIRTNSPDQSTSKIARAISLKYCL